MSDDTLRLVLALAFVLFSFAVVGYIDRLEDERLSVAGFVHERSCR